MIFALQHMYYENRKYYFLVCGASLLKHSEMEFYFKRIEKCSASTRLPVGLELLWSDRLAG